MVDPVSGIRDGELFTSSFFRNLRQGQSMVDAFEAAAAKVDEFTQDSSDVTAADSVQTPLLDDNGDGVGSPAGALDADGALANPLTLGVSTNNVDSIGWFSAEGIITLGPNDTLTQLDAFSQTPVPNGTTAWIAVKPPSYDGALRVDDGDQNNQQRSLELTQIVYDQNVSDLLNGRFRWTNINGLFSTPGAYQVFYYLRDGETNVVGTHILTTVYRQDQSNDPPTAPVLQFPEDNAKVGTTALFVWTASTDDDGAVSYSVELAGLGDTDFENVLARRDNIVSAFAQLSEDDGIQDGTTYLWRVVAYDRFGNSTPSTTTRTVIIDQGNATIPGSIVGEVTDARNDQPIEDATVSIGSESTETDRNGGYIFILLDPDTYNLTVSRDGYLTSDAESVRVRAGEVEVVDVALQSDARFVWGDVDGDLATNEDDGQAILEWVVRLRENFEIDPSIQRPGFPEGADVNANTILDVNDMTQILRLESGAISQLPADTNGDGEGPETKLTATPKGVDTPAPTISLVPTTEPSIGQPLDVNLVIDDATSLAGYVFTVGYDSNVMDYTGFSNTVSQWPMLVNSEIADTIIVGAGTPLNALNGGPAILATLSFVVSPDVPGIDTGLAYEAAIALDIIGAEIVLQVDSARIITGGNNAFDVDGDGQVNAVDIQNVINLVLGIGSGSLNGDINSDSNVDAIDVQLVINAVLGI